jgi:hypothetical protein
VPRRDLGFEGEIELAQMPPLPPLPQVLADMNRFGALRPRQGRLCIHDRESITRMSGVPLPRG